MLNFDPEFKDLPSYIIEITKRIWEDRDLESLNRFYDKDIIMRSPSGVVVGNQSVIKDTLETLAESPDKQLLAEDVIWSGDEESGFLSSHRLVTFGTHTGYGSFGPPTGRKYCVRAIADCAAKDNRIYDEWVMRDNSGVALQLGLDPIETARISILNEGGVETASQPFTPATDVVGRYSSRGNQNEWGANLADMLTDVMLGKVFVVRNKYDRAAEINHPGARTGWSWHFAETEWMRLRSSFPDATFSVDHCIGRSDPNMAPRAAVRWSLTGKHSGYGAFGKPTNAAVHIMGFTHAEFGPYGVKREFTLFDEIAIWKQILLHTGAL